MPTIVDPNASGRRDYVPTNVRQYSYPQGMDLSPQSPLHGKLLSALLTRIQESHIEMKKRFESWKEVDETLTAYVELDATEKAIRQKDKRRPVSIVVPYSYATLETILTYFVTAFLENPIFRYEGSGPDDIIGAILLEKVIEQHTANFKCALNLHTMWRDSLSYGIGVVTPTWDRKWGWKTLAQDVGFMSQIFGRFMSTGKKRIVQEETILYEGNRLKNIDPYMFLPDPNVPIHDVQQGEFVGWIEPLNIMKLKEMEQNDQDIFNVDYLTQMTAGSGKSQYNLSRSETGRYSKTSVSANPGASTTRPIDVIWVYWTLIPKEVGIGTSEYPEKWLFGVAADKHIICAKQLKLNHNMYPIAVCAPDFDGYSVAPVSRLELMHGMQQTINWLFNSHIANVRKAINDMLVVDPSLINMADLADPQPGKLVRMKRSAWGRGVENAVKQLTVTDITRSNIGDVGSLIDYMQRTSGAVDSISGMVRQSGERVTAEETRGARTSALSRLTKAAKLASIQAMDDISYMFASHTQQMMSVDTYVKVVGGWQEVLSKEYPNADRIKVSIYDILIDYDLIRKDGSVMGGEYAESWIELFRVITQQPMLFQQFDMTRIFKHVARLMGAKDINEFVLQTGALPPVDMKVNTQDAISQGVQSGNVVPINQYGAMQNV